MSASRIPNLKKLRTERLLTQAQLAAALDITPRTIIRWESGEGEPGGSELLALARFFRISVDQLLSDLMAPSSTESVIRVATLEGRQLDYWVAKSEGVAATLINGEPVIYVAGVGQSPVAGYSADAAASRSLIESKRLHLLPVGPGKFDGIRIDTKGWLARCDESPHTMHGRTYLEASMRAVVAAALGLELIG